MQSSQATYFRNHQNLRKLGQFSGRPRCWVAWYRVWRGRGRFWILVLRVLVFWGRLPETCLHKFTGKAFAGREIGKREECFYPSLGSQSRIRGPSPPRFWQTCEHFRWFIWSLQNWLANWRLLEDWWARDDSRPPFPHLQQASVKSSRLLSFLEMGTSSTPKPSANNPPYEVVLVAEILPCEHSCSGPLANWPRRTAGFGTGGGRWRGEGRRRRLSRFFVVFGLFEIIRCLFGGWGRGPPTVVEAFSYHLDLVANCGCSQIYSASLCVCSTAPSPASVIASLVKASPNLNSTSNKTFQRMACRLSLAISHWSFTNRRIWFQIMADFGSRPPWIGCGERAGFCNRISS